MYRELRDWIAARVGRDEGSDDEGGDARFVPSPLDASVRVAHGGGNDRGERELADIEERARALEGRRPDE